MTAAEMSTEMAAALRAPFAPEQIGKLPRITCRDCRDRNPNCSNHRRQKCRVCGGFLTTAHIHLDYVGHAAVTDRLLAVDPWWGWEPVAVDEHGRPLLDGDGALWIRLTIGGVTRLGVGHADGKTGPDAMKEAIGDAIRNAAMRFGVALDLWSKEQLRADAPPVEPAGDDRPGGELEAKRAVLDLCGGDRDLARQAWDRFGDDLAAVEAWVNRPMDEASDPDGPGVAGGLQHPAGDPQQRTAGGPHGVRGSGSPVAASEPEEAA